MWTDHPQSKHFGLNSAAFMLLPVSDRSGLMEAVLSREHVNEKQSSFCGLLMKLDPPIRNINIKTGFVVDANFIIGQLNVIPAAGSTLCLLKRI